MTFCIRFQNSCPRCNGTGKILDAVRVGDFLRKKRLSFSNSLREIATQMNITVAYLSDLERGRRNWTLDKINEYESCISKINRIKGGKKIWIYGLFNRFGKCEYIGATSNPKKRKSNYVVLFKHKQLTFKIITFCDGLTAPKKESDLIRQYQRNGECNLNTISHSVTNQSWSKKNGS